VNGRLSRLSALFGTCALALLVNFGPATAAPKSKPATAASSPKLAGLSKDKLDFIASTEALARLGLTPEKLRFEIDRRTPAEVDTYVTDMMAAVEASKFKPGVDVGEIALNPDAPNFNASTTLRPALFDNYQRDPGPFSLDKYISQRSGIPTFAHAPIAIRQADLVAGQVEVAFVGAPLDFSSGWRDAKHAPTVLRTMEGLSGVDVDTLIDPGLELRIADYGDISIDYMSVERSVDHVRMMVRDMASVGVTPFIVGGDHSLMYPDVAAMVDVYGKDKVGVVLLDAHTENQADSDHLISDKQAVSRLIADGVISGKNVVQLGLRDPDASAADLTRMRGQGIRYHTMAEIDQKGWEAVLKRAIAEVRDGPDNIFVSFDISVLDPVYATGAGRPAPNGLTMREAVPLVRRLCAENKVVGFEMLDVAPILDASYKTAQNANAVMHACLTGIALHKKGLTTKDYVSPLSVNHAQK
jgi:arginase family enzyme